MSSLDEIIELYARDVDVRMIDESLRLSVEERCGNLAAARTSCVRRWSGRVGRPST